MTPLDDFRARSKFLHQMTLDYASDIPEEFWDFSPHSRFGPFSKQLRHVVCVRGVYNDGLITRRPDFSKKHSFYSGGLTRDALTAALVEKQEELLAILSSLDPAQSIEFFGRPFSFVEFSYVMVQHEALHHGEWSVYASLAGFETPLSWRLNWGL